MQDKYCFNPNSYCPGHDNKRLAVEANASRLSDLPCSVLDKITHIEYKISLLFNGVRCVISYNKKNLLSLFDWERSF